MLLGWGVTENEQPKRVKVQGRPEPRRRGMHGHEVRKELVHDGRKPRIAPSTEG